MALTHCERVDGEAILATASSTGHIAFWDLNGNKTASTGGANPRLLHVYRGAHEGAVTALEWIPGQPLLISSGDDNSVKVNSGLQGRYPTFR